MAQSGIIINQIKSLEEAQMEGDQVAVTFSNYRNNNDYKIVGFPGFSLQTQRCTYRKIKNISYGQTIMDTCGDPEGLLAVLKKFFISGIYRKHETED